MGKKKMPEDHLEDANFLFLVITLIYSLPMATWFYR